MGSARGEVPFLTTRTCALWTRGNAADGPISDRAGPPVGYRRRHDTARDRRPRAPAPGSRPHGPRLPAAPRCPGHGAYRAHVTGSLLAQVPGSVWRDPLLLSHDATDRASEGPS